MGSGEFLESQTMYIVVNNMNHPWSCNGTELRTAPCNHQDSQRWVFGPEEFHGGKVLRHYLDGRGVDVHGWNIKNDGNNMGVENSVHGDCKGISYKLRLCGVEDKATGLCCVPAADEEDGRLDGVEE